MWPNDRIARCAEIRCDWSPSSRSAGSPGPPRPRCATSLEWRCPDCDYFEEVDGQIEDLSPELQKWIDEQVTVPEMPQAIEGQEWRAHRARGVGSRGVDQLADHLHARLHGADGVDVQGELPPVRTAAPGRS